MLEGPGDAKIVLFTCHPCFELNFYMSKTIIINIWSLKNTAISYYEGHNNNFFTAEPDRSDSLLYYTVLD